VTVEQRASVVRPPIQKVGVTKIIGPRGPEGPEGPAGPLGDGSVPTASEVQPGSTIVSDGSVWQPAYFTPIPEPTSETSQPVVTTTAGIGAQGTYVYPVLESTVAMLMIGWVGETPVPSVTIGGKSLVQVDIDIEGSGTDKRTLVFFADQNSTLAAGEIVFSDISGFAGGFYAAGNKISAVLSPSTSDTTTVSTLDTSDVTATNVLRYSVAIGNGPWLNADPSMELRYLDWSSQPNTIFAYAAMLNGNVSQWTQPEDKPVVQFQVIIQGTATSANGTYLKVVNGDSVWARITTMDVAGLGERLARKQDRLTPATAFPTPSAALRGVPFVLDGGPGVADVIYVCLKGSDDTYSWVQIPH